MKTLLVIPLIASLTACSVTNAEIDSGGGRWGEVDRCDNSITIQDGVLTATSICQIDNTAPEETRSD